MDIRYIRNDIGMTKHQKVGFNSFRKIARPIRNRTRRKVGFAGKNSSFHLATSTTRDGPILARLWHYHKKNSACGSCHAIARGTAWEDPIFANPNTHSLAVDPSRRSLVRRFARARSHAFSAD
jgi:hypothetical protein